MAGKDTTIVVRREPGRRDLLRKYRVLVDGSPVGLIADGGVESFAVAPGDHSVQLKLDWTRSPPVEITVEEGRELHLLGGPRGGSLTVLFDLLFRPRSYLRLTVAQG